MHYLIVLFKLCHYCRPATSMIREHEGNVEETNPISTSPPPYIHSDGSVKHNPVFIDHV